MIRRLGPRGLATLATHIASRQQYSTTPEENISILRELRAQGMRRSRIALALAESSGYQRPEEARFAALILDLGGFALLSLADAPHIPVLEDGGDAKLGALLLARWGYGLLLSNALRYQREQTQQLVDAHPLVRITHAARQLSEVRPSHIDAVCRETATLLDSDAGEIRELTESVLNDELGADQGRPKSLPETPAEASNAPRWDL